MSPIRTVAQSDGAGTTEASRGRLLPLAEAAAATHRNPELLRRWCAAGRILCQRIGRDWAIETGQLPAIEAMPRRGMSKRTDIAVADLGVLPSGLQAAIRDCLEDDEAVREVARGIEDSALIATDGRLLMARDGVLVTEPEHSRPVAWPLEWVRRVQLTAGTSAGALVLTPRDSSDRALVLVLGRPHLARAEAVAASLRARLAELGIFEDER